jgi:hypothetical protein
MLRESILVYGGDGVGELLPWARCVSNKLFLVDIHELLLIQGVEVFDETTVATEYEIGIVKTEASYL